jgi:hypothetical protein
VSDERAVAPGGLVLAPDGRLYVPMLAGQHLRVLRPEGDALVDEGPIFPGVRLRAASMLGCSLLFGTDRRSGATDEVRRVAIEPCAAPPGGGPAAGGPPPVPPATPGGPPGPAPGAGEAGATAAVSAAARRRVLARTAAALTRLGLRRLASRPAVALRAGGFAPGTLAVRVRHVPRRGRAVTVALARVQVRSRAAVRVRLATTRAGRARLRGLPDARLRVTVTHRATGGPARSSARTVVVRRRG